MSGAYHGTASYPDQPGKDSLKNIPDRILRHWLSVFMKHHLSYLSCAIQQASRFLCV